MNHSRLEKKLEFQLVLWASSSHGHFLLVLNNDLHVTKGLYLDSCLLDK